MAGSTVIYFRIIPFSSGVTITSQPLDGENEIVGEGYPDLRHYCRRPITDASASIRVMALFQSREPRRRERRTKIQISAREETCHCFDLHHEQLTPLFTPGVQFSPVSSCFFSRHVCISRGWNSQSYYLILRDTSFTKSGNYMGNIHSLLRFLAFYSRR